MKRLIFTVALFGFYLACSACNNNCPQSYKRADLYHGERHLRNYIFSAEPNRKPFSALRLKAGGNIPVSYKGNKGKDAQLSLKVKGYRADVLALELCLETKCVTSIDGSVEGPYSPLEIDTDAEGNIVAVGDTGTALLFIQEDVTESLRWKETCIDYLNRISQVRLTLKATGRHCKPEVRNMFMRACKKRQTEPAVCVYKRKVYTEGETWNDISKENNNCMSCRCTRQGKESCINIVCPYD